jgi:hypothetical protein
MSAFFSPGDYVIYRKQKCSVHPSLHAKEVWPCRHGDFYSYEVDKFWLVVAVECSNKVIVCTRRGKRLAIDATDPALRRAGWLERLLFRRRFPVFKVEHLLPIA